MLKRGKVIIEHDFIHWSGERWFLKSPLSETGDLKEALSKMKLEVAYYAEDQKNQMPEEIIIRAFHDYDNTVLRIKNDYTGFAELLTQFKAIKDYNYAQWILDAISKGFAPEVML